MKNMGPYEKTMFGPDRFVKVEDAALYLRCSLSSIRRWIVRGALPTYRRGRLIRIRLSDLEKVLEQSGSPETTRKAL